MIEFILIYWQVITVCYLIVGAVVTYWIHTGNETFDEKDFKFWCACIVLTTLWFPILLIFAIEWALHCWKYRSWG